MKFHFYLSFLILLLFADCKTGNKEIDCTLIDRPLSITSCGGFSFTYAFKFQKTRNKTEFIGLLFCPDFYGRDFFQVGQKYLLFTTDTVNVKADIIVNQYEDQNLPTYGIDSMAFRK
jgi:hypothetical protein